MSDVNDVSRWQIPKSWCWVSIGDICDVVGGGTPSTADARNFDGGDIPWITPADLSGYSAKYIDAGARSITRSGLEGSGARVMPAGTVLFSSRAPIGYVAIAKRPVSTNQGFKNFLPPKGVSSDFLYYYLKHAKALAVELSSGTTFQEISGKKAAQIPLVVAPQREQERIVEKLEELLSDLDAGVSALERARANLQRYRAAVLRAAVEGRLTEKWRAAHPDVEPAEKLLERILAERRRKWEEAQLKKFAERGQALPKKWKDAYAHPQRLATTELPALPRGWAYCSLAELLPGNRSGTRTGPFGTLLAKHEHQKSGVPVVGIENISSMRFVAGSKIHISQEKADELKDYDLVPGDVVISRSGTVGEVCVIPDELGSARMSTNLMRVRLVPDGMRPLWFCALFAGRSGVSSQVHKLCSGSTRDFLNTEILMSIVFPLPPLNEQDEILKQLESIRSELDRVESELHRIDVVGGRLRQSILKRAFEGKLVPQDPKDEPASALLARIRAARQSNAAGRSQKRGVRHRSGGLQSADSAQSD